MPGWGLVRGGNEVFLKLQWTDTQGVWGPFLWGRGWNIVRKCPPPPEAPGEYSGGGSDQSPGILQDPGWLGSWEPLVLWVYLGVKCRNTTASALWWRSKSPLPLPVWTALIPHLLSAFPLCLTQTSRDSISPRNCLSQKLWVHNRAPILSTGRFGSFVGGLVFFPLLDPSHSI